MKDEDYSSRFCKSYKITKAARSRRFCFLQKGFAFFHVNLILLRQGLHKLKGGLKDTGIFDRKILRIIRFQKNLGQNSFIDIGPHDQVY